jgi:hypothetical protein
VKLSILGTEYDYGLALRKAKLTDLYDLSLAAKIGVRSVNAMLFRLDEASTVDERLAASEEPDVLIATQGLVFLCRRHAGEKVSFEDSAVSWEDLAWVVEDSDLEVEPDPTQALAAEPAQGSNAEPNKNEPTPSPKKSKTSKPRSTDASS